MANDVTLSTFPSTKCEALAMLYVQSQDLSSKTPAEIHTMYCEAYKEMLADRKQKIESNYSFR